MATTRIVVDGDTTGYVGSQDRARRATEATARAAKSIGAELAQTGTGLAKSILLVGTLRQGFVAAADAARSARREAADINRQQQSQQIEAGRELVANAPQIDLATREALLAQIGQGATTGDETAAFIAQLARQGGRRLFGRQAMELTGGFTSGMFSQDELMQRLSFGRGLSADEIAARRQALPAATLSGIEARRQAVADQTRTAQEAAAVPGAATQQAVEDELTRRRLRSPRLQALATTADNLVGGILEPFGLDQESQVRDQMAGRGLNAFRREANQRIDALVDPGAGDTRSFNQRFNAAADEVIGVPVQSMLRWFGILSEQTREQTETLRSATTGIPTLRDDKR
jgi:hypothetical protein